jgi:hypothetical protein
MEPQSCNPCASPFPVQIPGTPGAAGAPGQPALSFLNGNFSGGAVGDGVTAPVNTGSPYSFFEYVLIQSTQGGFPFTGYFQITGVFGTSLGLSCLNNSTGVTFLSGQAVSPIGNPGTNAFATVATIFTIPSIGSTVAATVFNNGCFIVGQNVAAYSASGGGVASFVVTAFTGSNGITLQFLGNPGDVTAGNTIAANANLVAIGAIGNNAYSVTTQQSPSIPAIGSSITVNVNNNSWMTVGATVVANASLTGGGNGPAHFAVASLTGTTQASLTFLGYTGDVVGGSTNVIASGQVIAPSGNQPIASTPQSSYASGTKYTLTASMAQVVMGTTSAQVTLPASGTWLINASLTLSTNGAASGGVLVAELFRTNNTPAAVTNSSTSINFLGTTAAYFDTTVVIPVGVYVTATAGDIIQIYAQQTNEVTAFSFITAAHITAVQIA